MATSLDMVYLEEMSFTGRNPGRPRYPALYGNRRRIKGFLLVVVLSSLRPQEVSCLSMQQRANSGVSRTTSDQGTKEP